MTATDLETKCQQAILQIADVVKDIDMKLSHIIEYGIPARVNRYHGRYGADRSNNDPSEGYRSDK